MTAGSGCKQVSNALRISDICRVVRDYDGSHAAPRHRAKYQRAHTLA
jgi:hypothetical protein